ncbi:hypothetical protein RhiirA1_484748 [Rhizophagus irregularis]|uniref:Uncharacterized protein n=1 Tax=Rhizophagus irregularis TaxID=588596 RepID=A0A2N0QIX7_9GLOM|nr:hypothetical protein RhiirA1_484748 [Rhizophagus irregularis]
MGQSAENFFRFLGIGYIGLAFGSWVLNIQISVHGFWIYGLTFGSWALDIWISAFSYWALDR